MFDFSLTYPVDLNDPRATLRMSCNDIEQALLSIAKRVGRNRSDLYQKKHGGALHGYATRQRDPKHAGLNEPIAEHYQSAQEQWGLLEEKRVVAFPISDLTANPMRVHYDASIRADQATMYANDSDSRLFYLDDEPIGEVPYTLLLSYTSGGSLRFTIEHEVLVSETGTLPDSIPKEVRDGLNWWAACPPVVSRGSFDAKRYAELDYDHRHVIGFPILEEDRVKKKELEARLREVFETFPSWSDWCSAIQSKLPNQEDWVQGSHAVLGISEDDLVLVHRTAPIPVIAEELIDEHGVQDAVLLDSGGSCAIWANWINRGAGGVLASHFNFRPERGAVVFLVLEGKRGRVKKKGDG